MNHCPHKELPFRTGHEFVSHLQGMICSCTSPFLDRKAQNEDLLETGCWLFSGLDKIAIQPITNHQLRNKDSPLFPMLDSDLTLLSNSKLHTSVSRLQSHLLAPVILDPFQTSSKPLHNTEETPIAVLIVLLL